MLITISREYGAGGSQIAAAVGKQLGWRVIDNELIDEVAHRAGLTPDEVKQREERGPTFVERLARAFAASTPEMLGSETLALPEVDEARLAKITQQVVADAMRDHAVLVGRAAVVVVPPEQPALNVRLVASPAFRARAVAQRQGITLAEAEKQVKDVDAHRAGYHHQYSGRDWADPRNYHMILNTEKLGFERTVEMIVVAAGNR